MLRKTALSSLVLSLPFAVAPAQTAPTALRLLPGDSIAAFAAAGRESIRAAWAESPWAALWAEPEIQGWLAPVLREISPMLETMRGEVGFTPGDLFDAVEGGFAVAWTRFDPAAKTGAVALVVECGSRRDRFEEMIGVALGRARENEGHFRTAFAGSTFLAVAGDAAEDALAEMVERAQGLRGETSLVQNPRFRSTLEKTGGGLFVGYFDVGACLRAVGAAEGTSRWRKGLDAVGLEPDTVVGGSHSFGAGGSRTALYLGGARKGLLSLAQMPAGEFRTLRLVPRGAAGAGAVRVDPKRTWETVVEFADSVLPRKPREKFRSGVQKFEGLIGLSIGGDLLAALGDEIGMFTLAREGEDADEPLDFDSAFQPDLERSVAVSSLRRPAEIEGHVESLLRNVGLAPTMRTQVIDGRRVHSFVFLMMPVAYAVEGNLLVVAASADRVAETLRRASEPGFVSIERDPRFEKALAGLPGPRAAVTFSDTKATIDETLRGFSMMGGILEQVSDAARRSASERGAKWSALLTDLFANLPSAEVFRRHLGRDSASVLVPDGDGILCVSVGP